MPLRSRRDGSKDCELFVGLRRWAPQDRAVQTSHAYAAEGTYTVTLTVVDDVGHAGSTSSAVTVGAGGTGSTVTVARTLRPPP